MKRSCIAILDCFPSVGPQVFHGRQPTNTSLVLRSFFLEMGFNPHCTDLRWYHHLWNEQMFVEALFCSRFLSSFFRKWCTKNCWWQLEETEVSSSDLSSLWSYQKSIVLDKDKLRMTCKIKETKKLANFCAVTSNNSLGRKTFCPWKCFSCCAHEQGPLCYWCKEAKSYSCRRCTRPLNLAYFAQVRSFAFLKIYVICFNPCSNPLHFHHRTTG